MHVCKFPASDIWHTPASCLTRGSRVWSEGHRPRSYSAPVFRVGAGEWPGKASPNCHIGIGGFPWWSSD